MSSEHADDPVPGQPHIVINDAATLRPNDLTQMGNVWMRIITAMVLPAPPGTRIVDGNEIRYVDELETNVVDQLALTADGRTVRKSLLPGDKPCRIIRRIQAGDMVAPLGTVIVPSPEPNELVAEVVSVEDDGRSLTIELRDEEDGVASIARNTVYAITEGTRP